MLVAHSDRILREALILLLSQQPEITVVATAPYRTATTEHQNPAADVALLDTSIRMDGESLADRIQNLSRTAGSGLYAPISEHLAHDEVFLLMGGLFLVALMVFLPFNLERQKSRLARVESKLRLSKIA